jgi:Phage integrase family
VLRHTFGTHLADTGADTAVIRELADDADIRTTTIYTDVNPARLEHAIAKRSRQRQGARLTRPAEGRHRSMAPVYSRAPHQTTTLAAGVRRKSAERARSCSRLKTVAAGLGLGEQLPKAALSHVFGQKRDHITSSGRVLCTNVTR